MTTTLDGGAMLKAILDGADRAAAMLAYADWLRELGQDDAAYAWEWMARRGRFPSHFIEAGTWHWLADDDPEEGPCYLPAPLLRAMPPGEDWAEGAQRFYDIVDFRSLPAAAGALADGLKALRDITDLRRPS